MSDEETQEWTQAIELLKAIFQVDANKRITPTEVLDHPFITQSYDSETLQPVVSKPSTRQVWTGIMREEYPTEFDSRYVRYFLMLLDVEVEQISHLYLSILVLLEYYISILGSIQNDCIHVCILHVQYQGQCYKSHFGGHQ